MSFAYSNTVWNGLPKIKGGKLLVLLSLCDRADQSGVCWPSINDISRRARLQARHVTRLLGELERKDQLIKKDLQKGRNGVNRYTLTFAPDWVTQKTGRDDLQDTPGVTPKTPKPSKNHQRTKYIYERDKYCRNRPRTDTEQELANAF